MFQYDQAGRLLEETNGQGTPKTDTIYLNGVPVATIAAGGGVSYLHTDGLGTPQIATNAAKTPDWGATYEPFGGLTGLPSGSITQNLRFPGQYADAETGFYQNGFRDYAPLWGRYLESDPIGLRSGTNTYGYVGGNPSKYTDPEGKCFGPLLIYCGYEAVLWAGIGIEAAFAYYNGYVSPTSLFGDIGSLASGAGKICQGTEETGTALGEGESLLNSSPIDSALKDDLYHRSATFAREDAAANGISFPITGADGITRTLIQTPGELNGIPGRFEYIVDQSGNLTHQRFVPGGKINGIPNKP